MIYNEKLNFKNHIKNGTVKKKDILTRIKQKITLIKKVKYWMSHKELIIYANAHIQWLLSYGISIWSKENINIVDKVEKLRLKFVKVIFGSEVIKDMNDEQMLNLLNWKKN